MAESNQKPHAAIDAGYKIGDYAIFGGYQAQPEGGDEILQKDDPVKIVSFDDNGLDIIVVKVDEEGEEIVDDQNEPVAVERVYVEELIRATVVEEAEAETPAEPEAEAETEAEAPAKAAPKKKAAAKKAPAKKATKKTAVEAEPEAETSAAITVSDVVVAPSVAEILSQSDALTAAKTLVERAEQTDFTLGGVLANIQETGAYKRAGYSGKGAFDNYVKAELFMEKRKAYYLINIYSKFMRCGIPEAKLAEIGWSKAKELVRVDDDALRDNYDQLFEYAKDNNREDLISYLKTNYAVASRGQTVRMVSFTFRLAEEEAEAARTAITEAQAIIGEADPNKAFAYILGDWRNSAAGSDMTLDDFVAMAEAKFGVTLTATPVEGDEPQAEEEQADAAAA